MLIHSSSPHVMHRVLMWYSCPNSIVNWISLNSTGDMQSGSTEQNPNHHLKLSSSKTSSNLLKQSPWHP
ncbi:hypothetical protein PISMIDRAFT_654032 [Pisolithus microcarpus 441]|uniref:Unplaced genomic scaffold scaffold_65, whole genome shotgun sequence n=1 Tax=Pisolithus microcarpus 441 TaxID=765257 RepID=A0A0C9YY07_9AGAM|nr:hypothetical protein PISMIDRAFT_654032 [Pisolithus microcarpus 441]